MEHTIDYFIKRKSDGKLMQIRHLKITEEDILRLAKEEATAPMHYGNLYDEDNEYEFSDFNIAETKI